jgi:uncharacterized protein YjbJ (UPF0337 family)
MGRILRADGRLPRPPVFAAFESWRPGQLGRRLGTSLQALTVQRGSASGTGERLCRRHVKELVMSLGKRVKDKGKEVKGKTKKNTGKATGDKSLRAKGKLEELTGKVKGKGEKAKHAAKK